MPENKIVLARSSGGDTIYLGKIQGNVLDKDKYLLKILTSCRKAIIRKWLQVDPPTKDKWLGIVNEIYAVWRGLHLY